MGIEMFKAFAKGPDKKVEVNKDVWIYTRVSSKEQELNKSLNTQIDNANQCAKEKGFNVTQTFGGTYESASGDMTRKEFKKLIEAIRKAKKKPHAILLNTISRFSRTGGAGVSLATELIEDLRVHLYEVSTGRNTFTEEGKLEIYRGLLYARQENLDRMRITIPGMKRFLEEGNWLGCVPRGYDHFGPRVKNHKFYSEKQKVVLNADGKILKQAWQWKLQGERDFIIERKLADLGLKGVKKQTLSEMWRNPFYCGICCHKMLDGKVVYGRWAKMISEKEFLMVQEVLKGNRYGYKQDKANPSRPLNSFIQCKDCGGKMSGYEVKKKGVHYYKCQHCKGVSINADTTRRAMGIGAHEMFKNLLSEYTRPATLNNLFEAQLRLTYETLNKEQDQVDVLLKKELEKAEVELKNLKKKYMMGDGYDKDIYEELKREFETKIDDLKKSVGKVDSEISNLDLYINISKEVSQNISKYWGSDGLETKKRVQELVFPEGLVIDAKQRTYLTKRVNCIFEINRQLSGGSEDEKKKRQPISQLPSCFVAGAGFEPTTFGL